MRTHRPTLNSTREIQLVRTLPQVTTTGEARRCVLRPLLGSNSWVGMLPSFGNGWGGAIVFGRSADGQMREILKAFKGRVQRWSPHDWFHSCTVDPRDKRFVSTLLVTKRRCAGQAYSCCGRALLSGHASRERTVASEARANNSRPRELWPGNTRSVKTSSPSLTNNSTEHASMNK